MATQKSKNQLDKRRDHNKDIIRRMRSGESLKTVDSRASWFPPRPVIEKDQEAINRLYNIASGSGLSEDSRPQASGSEANPDVLAFPRRRLRFDDVG